MKTVTSFVVLAAAAWLHLQEPQEPKKTEMSPPRATTARQDPLPGAPKRHRFEGVYELKRRVIKGVDDRKPNRGYLAFTGRHLLFALATPGLGDEFPLVNSSVRTWQEVQEGVRTTVKLDYFSDSEGVIHLQPEGQQEVRRIEVIQGGLRIVQGDHTWLEFERIE